MTEAVPRIWRNQRERYNLIGVKCETCNASFFPTRKVCPNCRRKSKLVEQKMPDTGKIYSFTLVNSAPAGFEYEVPYHLAIIELDNGVHLLSQIVDSDDGKVKIGAKVKALFRRIQSGGEEGAIAYGYKFKVV